MSGVPTFTTSADSELVGTCAQSGARIGESGKASVEELSNSSKLAKVIYFYAIKKEWWGNNSIFFDDVTKSDAVHYMCQAQRQGYDRWYEITADHYLAKAKCDAVIEQLNNTDFDNIEVPVSFVAYICRPEDSSKQIFVLWKMKATGKFRLKKSSAYTQIIS